MDHDLGSREDTFILADQGRDQGRYTPSITNASFLQHATTDSPHRLMQYFNKKNIYFPFTNRTIQAAGTLISFLDFITIVWHLTNDIRRGVKLARLNLAVLCWRSVPFMPCMRRTRSSACPGSTIGSCVRLLTERLEVRFLSWAPSF